MSIESKKLSSYGRFVAEDWVTVEDIVETCEQCSIFRKIQSCILGHPTSVKVFTST